MEDYKKEEFDVGFEAGVRRMAARLRNYIITNMNLSGGANIKLQDVEKMKRKILKTWEDLVNE